MTVMATDQLIARDAVIRQAAFDHVRALQSRDLESQPRGDAQGVHVRRSVECAPGAGQIYAAVLTICRAWLSSNWAGLR